MVEVKRVFSVKSFRYLYSLTHFVLTGVSLARNVENAVRSTGIDEDDNLFKLYPKMCELLVSSKSDNTIKSYFNAFKRWERFISL